MTQRLHKVPPQIQRLYDRGLKSVIPLFKGKSPAYSEWQKITDEEAQEKIWGWRETHPGGQVNYGIRLGSAFGGICDIDLDSEECRRLARYYLPDTAKFGRGGVVTHYLYRCTGKLETRRYAWDKRDEKSVLLEFRASGQTMAPGSVHPDTGEPIEWYGSEEVGIYELEGEELEQNVRELAAAALLLRDWQSGGRDELAVCLVGSMIRAGWEDSEIDRFLLGILIESGDEENEKRLKSERLREELESGGRVPGLKRLREICSGGSGLGLRGFESIVEWLELGGGDLVEQMNAQFAVVSNRGGSVAIMQERDDGVEFMDQRSFSLMHANRHTMAGGRQVTADKFWLTHKDRREYLRGVVFKPGREARDGEYNLWRGFSVAEVEGEWGVGWELYLEHLRGEVCGGDEKVLKWLLGWMAHRVQRPWEVPESAVVLIGERGDGKSSVFKILGKLFGKHYMTVTNPKHLMGNFNQHLMDKVLVLADEAVWGGDKTHEGVLKVMISEEKRVIEIKGKDAFEVENCTGYGICSNNDWVVPVGRHERRFLILRTRGVVRGDLSYWDRMYDQMSVVGGGLGRMLWDLKRWDLEGWRGNRPPGTEELAAQMARGMEHWVQYLCEAVDMGLVSPQEGVWADDLYDGYCTWMKRMGYRIDSEIVFIKNVQRMFPTCTKVRGRREVWAGRSGKVSVKKNRLVFGEDVTAERDAFLTLR